MEKRTSVFARILAALALAAAVVAVVVIVAAATSDSSNQGQRQHRSGQAKHKQAEGEGEAKKQTTAATYTVQTGDTLISIAHQTGVPVEELMALNPEVDPQILIAGQTLKLR